MTVVHKVETCGCGICGEARATSLQEAEKRVQRALKALDAAKAELAEARQVWAAADRIKTRADLLGQ